MIQLRINERSVTHDELQSIIESVSTLALSTEIPYRTAESAIRGMKFEPLRLVSDDEDARIVICAQPSTPTTEVKQGPEIVDAGFYILNEDEEEAWFVEAQAAQKFDSLPELRQAFHKGDFWEREADYEYVFTDGGTYTAARAPNPVDRLDDGEIVITNLTMTNGSSVPFEWYAKAEDGRHLYMRSRSGSVQLRVENDEDDDPIHGENIFQAYLGREHPGTRLREHEVYNLVSSVDYIDFADDPAELPEVSDEFMESIGPDLEEIVGDVDGAEFDIPEPEFNEEIIEDDDFYEGEVEEFTPDDEE